MWRMDLSVLGDEFGSCGHRWEGKHTKEMQNRPEVRSLGMGGARYTREFPKLTCVGTGPRPVFRGLQIGLGGSIIAKKEKKPS